MGERSRVVVNIGPKERRKRRALAVVMMVISIVSLAVFVLADVHRLWRIILFVPFWVAALGWFQAREHT